MQIVEFWESVDLKTVLDPGNVPAFVSQLEATTNSYSRSFYDQMAEAAVPHVDTLKAFQKTPDGNAANGGPQPQGSPQAGIGSKRQLTRHVSDDKNVTFSFAAPGKKSRVSTGQQRESTHERFEKDFDDVNVNVENLTLNVRSKAMRSHHLGSRSLTSSANSLKKVRERAEKLDEADYIDNVKELQRYVTTMQELVKATQAYGLDGRSGVKIDNEDAFHASVQGCFSLDLLKKNMGRDLMAAYMSLETKKMYSQHSSFNPNVFTWHKDRMAAIEPFSVWEPDDLELYQLECATVLVQWFCGVVDAMSPGPQNPTDEQYRQQKLRFHELIDFLALGWRGFYSSPDIAEPDRCCGCGGKPEIY